MGYARVEASLDVFRLHTAGVMEAEKKGSRFFGALISYIRVGKKGNGPSRS